MRFVYILLFFSSVLTDLPSQKNDDQVTYNLQDCSKDIDTYHCHPTDVVKDGANRSAIESQTITIHCLRARLEKLEDNCRSSLLHILEQQSKDYHLDPILLRACQEDRARLCADVESGEGRVYECLRMHKLDQQMSSECKQEIFERQRLFASDYRINFRFAEACAVDIANAKCDVSNGKSGASLSGIILCLEAVEKPRLTNENEPIRPRYLLPACKAELNELRRELLQDYRLSPDLMLHCESTIERHCASRKRKPMLMLHCLMKVINQAMPLHDRPPNDCIDAVHDLIKVTDLEEDILLDPIITHVCHSMLVGKCASKRPDHGRTFECLFANQMDPTMSVSCRAHIRELYYFVTRDITLDDRLLRACVADAGVMCNLPKNVWTDPSKPDALVLTCLYNHRSGHEMPNKTLARQLSPQCETEVLRVVHGRAIRVSFEPRVFEVCLADLAAFCDPEEETYEDTEDYPMEDSATNEFGAESRERKRKRAQTKSRGTSGMECLQRNLQALQPECRAAVVNVSKEVYDDPNLDKLVSDACLAAELRFCSGYSNPDQMLTCLIQFKNHPEMGDPCRAAIEHIQRVALLDFEISTHFKKRCQADAEKHCADQIHKGTAAVMSCLSQKFTVYRLVTFYRLFNRTNPPAPPMSHGCMEQLVLELRQRSESIELDPELAEACEQDRLQFCAQVRSGNARIIRCLQHHRNKLSDRCHAKLFERDELAAVENRADYSLMQLCDQMIRVHCSPVMAQLNEMGELDLSSTSTGHHRVFECLIDAMNHENTAATFDPMCRRHLWDTMVLRSQDYRLDPELQISCYPDIKRYCIAEAEATLHSAFEQNGPVLRCLKKHFAEIKQQDQMLSLRCNRRVRLLIQWEGAIYHMDPVLVGACKADVLTSCSTLLSNDSIAPEELDVAVRECLKDVFHRGRMQSRDCAKEIVLSIKAGQADIHVDPILYQACAVELTHVCGEVSPGQGRQMTCLLRVMERPDAKDVLGPICLGELIKRRQLWDHVSLLESPNDLKGLVKQVQGSQWRNSLLICLFIFLTVVFSCGLCCGRVTKRVPIDMKSR